MPSSPLLTGAPTPTRAAQGAAQFNAAKSLTAKNIDQSICPAARSILPQD
jgi:hypothetical protein